MHQKRRLHNQANLQRGASYKTADLTSLQSWHHEKEKMGKSSRIKRLQRLNQILVLKNSSKDFWDNWRNLNMMLEWILHDFGRFLLVFLAVIVVSSLYKRMQTYSWRCRLSCERVKCHHVYSFLSHGLEKNYTHACKISKYGKMITFIKSSFGKHMDVNVLFF